MAKMRAGSGLGTNVSAANRLQTEDRPFGDDAFVHAVDDDSKGYSIASNAALFDYTRLIEDGAPVELANAGGEAFARLITNADTLINDDQGTLPAGQPAPLSDEVLVNTHTTDMQFFSSVAAFQDGGYIVVWTSAGDMDGNGYGIFGQRYDASGAVVGGEFQVNSSGLGNQHYASIAVLNNGSFVVTWTSAGQDGSGEGIYGKMFDASGSEIVGEFQVNSYTDSNQRLSTTTALSDGGFLVTWMSYGQDGDGDGIFGQRYTAAGNTAGTEFQVNSTISGIQIFASSTTLENGDFVVTWVSSNQDGSGNGVYAQVYSVAGVARGSEMLINETVDNDQDMPSIAALAGGGFVVTWSSFDQDGSGYGIYGRIFDSSGQPVGGEFHVNMETQFDQDYSSVTPLAGGGFVVTWSSAGQDGDDWGVYGRRFDNNGQPDGGEFLINQETQGYQIQGFAPRHAITQLADGSLIVTWHGNGIDDDFGVFTRHFGVAGANTAPEGHDTTITINEDQIFKLYSTDFGFTDHDGDNFASIVIGTLPHPGTLTFRGMPVTSGDVIAVADINMGQLVFTPMSDAYGLGADSFSFYVRDDSGTNDTDLNPHYIWFDINPVNDAPVGANDSYTVDEDGTLILNVLANDSDPDGNPLNIASNTNPAHGSLTLNGDGTVTYTPNANYNGSDSFTYTVTDGSATSSPVTVNITVTPVADNPVVAGLDGDVLNYLEGMTGSFPTAVFDIDLDAVVTDVDNENYDGAVLTVRVSGNKVATEDRIGFYSGYGISTSAGNVLNFNGVAVGTYTSPGVGLDRVFTFNSNATADLFSTLLSLLGYTNTNTVNPSTAQRTIEITLNDGRGGETTVHTYVNVIAVNDAPTGTDHTVTLAEDGSYALAASDFGFSDSDGNSLAAVKISSVPGAGSLKLNGIDVHAGDVVSIADLNAGHLIFTPAPNANGNGYASFTFQVQDDGGTANGGVDTDQSANTFTFDVTPVNDAPNYSAPGYTITRVSTDSSGAQANGASTNGVFSPDGTKIVFSSAATNLVAGDTNGVADLFVKDLATGTVTRLAEGGAGTFDKISFSPDGTRILFQSDNSNLVAGDTNGKNDIFVMDMATGVITRVSTDANGVQGVAVGGAGDTGSTNALWSPDGTKVIFTSAASNLVAGDTNGFTDVFVKDLTTGAIIRVSTDASGAQGNASSTFASFSPDGTKVVFVSGSTNLLPSGNTGGVFIKDLATGTVTLVSSSSAGVQGTGGGSLPGQPFFSPDGTMVAFVSGQTALVAGDTNTVVDLFVKDLRTGTIIRLDLTGTGVQAIGGAVSNFAWSADGTRIIFQSAATNLAPGDTNGASDIFIVNVGTTPTTFIENGAAAIMVAPFVTQVDDLDSANFAGGTLAINLTAGAVTGDTISLRTTPSVTISGLDVSVSGVVVGTLTTTATGISIALNASADNRAVSLLTQASGFFTASENPTNAARTITFALTDGDGATTSFTRTVNVVPVNDAPVGVADSYTIGEDGVLTVGTATGVLANDSDVDGPTLIATLVTGPAHGTLILNADGSFTYTPVANYNGPDSFTYNVGDGLGSTGPITVTLDVTAVNDAPVAANDSYATNQNQALTISAASLLANDSDADGDPLSVISTSTPLHGTLVPGGNGTFAYTPNTNYYGNDSFTYTVSDGHGGTSSATVLITVNQVNVAPVGVNDSYTIGEDGVLTVGAATGVLSNDTDADHDTLSATLVTGPSHGALILNADGSFTYTPTGNYNGPDSFTYNVGDGSETRGPVTVTLDVTSVNDAPVLDLSGFAVAGIDTTAAYTEGSPAVKIAQSITISDVDSSVLTGAKVVIASGFVTGDILRVNGGLSGTSSSGISYSYNTATGVLTLSGNASVADYQALISTLAFKSNSYDPGTARDIVVIATDGTEPSTAAHIALAVTPINDAPMLDLNGFAVAGINTTAAYTEGAAAVKIAEGVEISDADNTVLTGAKVSIESGFVAGDVLRVNGGVSGTTASGIAYSYDAGTGVLTLIGSASVADYQTALATLAFKSDSDNPGTARDIVVTVNDGSANSDAAHITLAVTPINDAPVLDLNGFAVAGINTTAAYTEGSAAVKLIQSVAVSDPDSTHLTGAKISIASGFVDGDIMRVNGTLSGTTGSGIAYNYDSSTGVLTLSGSASVADYQSVLATLQFKSHSDDPGTARDIVLTVTDGAATSDAAHIALAVTPINNAMIGPVPVAEAIAADKGHDAGGATDAVPAFLPHVEIGLDHGPVPIVVDHALTPPKEFLG